MTNFLKDYGSGIVKNGYPVVGILAGYKRPGYPNWSQKGLTAEQCKDPRTIPGAPGMVHEGVGILCGKGENPVCCIDVDSNDAGLSQEFEERVKSLLGPEYVLYKRTGKAPKFALMVRASEPHWSKRVTAKFEKAGKTAQLEILGEGQQFVAYAVHPETGLEYLWSDWEYAPAVTRADELPVITYDQVTTLLITFEFLAKKHGYTPKGGSASADAPRDYSSSRVFDEDFNESITKQPLGKTLQEAEEVLNGIELKDGDREKWLKIGMALHHEFNGSPEAKALWDKRSENVEGFRGPESSEKTWESFKHDSHVASVTFRTLIKEFRERNPGVSDNSLTQRSLARRVAETRGHLVRLAKDRGKLGQWYRYINGHWETIFSVYPATLVGDVIEKQLLEDARNEKDPDMRERLLKFAMSCQAKTYNFISGTVNYLAAQRELWVSSADFDADTRYFGAANGDIDLYTGKLLPHDPARLISKHSEVEYDPNAECPLWLQTLKDCLVSEEAVGYLQRLVGFSALGCPDGTAVFPIFYGLGRNGKSTVVNVLNEVFGSYQRPMSSDTLLLRRGGSKGGTRSDIAALLGCRLAVTSETDEYAKLDQNFIKQISGGDAISFRALYQEESRARFHCMLVMLTNHKPDIGVSDPGFWSRIKIIEFPHNFENDPEWKDKRNPNLVRDLQKELPGILNWVVKGAQEFLRVGLQEPECVRMQVKEYRSDQDLLGLWLEDRCVTDKEAEKVTDQSRHQIGTLFRNWKNYTKYLDEGCTYQKRQEFKDQLKSRGFAFIAGRGTSVICPTLAVKADAEDFD